MVAFNFSPEHAPKVEARTKKQTIRSTLRAKIGDKVQLYEGQRTKNCRKLVDDDPTIIRTGRVEIDDAGLKFDGYYQATESAEGYARLDGFKSFDEMRKWFRNRYPDRWPYRGYEHRWDWIE